ncbi:MAG: MotA/TolQ/ExbB proton channel family protein [Proteobacteria bacterium]|nr:MotA/TolQ/ExbB proton channel family protein [Pseudomonadota bacterium]
MIHSIKARQHYTRNVLIQFLVALAVFVVLLYWRIDFFRQVYFENQVNSVGWTINGGIALLFVFGLTRVVMLLLRYRREEASINRFVRNLAVEEDPLAHVDQNSIVADRYDTLQMLHRKRASINHSALAATLIATEASYNSFPKFVHNTLILTGVFGTIVSLSIALIGASDMIEGSAQVSGIGTVIHGMSTALSTTMTAIIAYLFFGYFYLKLTDAQTYLISRVEEVTATHLMPYFQLSNDAMLKEYSDSITSAANLVKRFDKAQATYQMAAKHMADSISKLQTAVVRDEQQVRQMNARLEQLVKLSEKNYEKENHTLERMITVLHKNSRKPD